MRRLFVTCLLGMCVSCAPEGPSAYIDFNLVPDQECVYDPTGDVSLYYGVGYYDIAESGGPDGEDERFCARPYTLSLRVNSGLRSNVDQELGRAEPNVLQVNRVEVTLMTLQQEVLSFPDAEVTLPNPFRVTTTFTLDPTDSDEPSRGVARVDVVPAQYASQLSQFVGDQILVEVQMFGTTLGDVDVEFQPYLYPIRICDGCMSLCLENDLTKNSLTPEDVLDADSCQDNAGADGRLCIDPNC